MPHDMELVEDDAGLRGVLLKRVSKRFPHVHRRQLNALRFPRTKLEEEEVQILLASTGSSHPNGATPNEVADDDAVIVTRTNRDRVHPNRSGGRCPRSGDLPLHVDLVEILDRVFMQTLDLGHGFVGHFPTRCAHMHGESLGVPGILRQPIQPFYKHRLAPRTKDSPAFKVEIDSPPGHRKISHTADPPVVSSRTAMPTTGTDRCFFRRRSAIPRAYRSPITPKSCG